MKWSIYQKAFFTELEQNEANHKKGIKRNNLVLGAMAGSGKSTVCLHGIRIVTQHGATAAYSMFNSDTVYDFEKKIANAGLGDIVKVKTAHSFGLSAFKRKFGWGVKTDRKKVINLVDAFIEEEGNEQWQPFADFIVKLVGFAKDAGIGIFSGIRDFEPWQAIIDRHDLDVPSVLDSDIEYDDVIGAAMQFLETSNKITDVIDFSDMIYLPLIYNCRFEQFDYVFVDEMQDTNPTRRELYLRMIAMGGAMVGVGDRNQAIYGFTGADNDAMDIISQKLNAKELPLAVCYRCDRAIIQHAQKWVPEIEFFDGNGEGKVESQKYADFLSTVGTRGLTNKDAILCRKNAPLVATAFSLIRKGIGCRIEGKDIGWNLILLARKWKVVQLPDLLSRLEQYQDREVEKALTAKSETKAEMIADKCDTLRALIDRTYEVYGRGAVVAELEKVINDMFSNYRDKETRKDLLTLSSVHKSKGREWRRVFLIGREQFMPSPYAKQDWQKDQERNLIYVAITRAMNELVELTEYPEKEKAKKD